MKKRYFIICLLQFVVLFSIAQKKEPVYKFHSINSLVLVNGSNSVSAALQTVNGFQKKNLFAGIGTGLDYYLYRTVPLFADVRYSFGKKKNKIFVYADAGISFSWVDTQPVFIWNGNRNTLNYKNGIYTDAGAGYNIAMKKNNSIVVSLGYSQKTLKEEYSYLDWRSNEMLLTTNNYRLNRIMLKVGWQF